MSLLDEDGLCRLSGFTPEACGCDKHRGALLDGADEAIIEELVRSHPGGRYAENRYLSHDKDSYLPGKRTAE